MSRLFRVRVQRMLDNEPELVKELLDKGDFEELERLVDNQTYQAHLYEKKLLERGWSQPEAQEESVRAVLAPAREWGEEAPQPLSDQDQARVWKGLDRLEEIEEQRSSRRE